mgnify:CR=1 FL=1
MKKNFLSILLALTVFSGGMAWAVDNDDVPTPDEIGSRQEWYDGFYTDKDGEEQFEEGIPIDEGFSEDDLLKMHFFEEVKLDGNELVWNINDGLGDIFEMGDPIAKYISDDFRYNILSRSGGKVVGIDSLNKGRPYEEAEKDITARTDLREEQKQDLLKWAKEVSNKWYVSSSRQFNPGTVFYTMPEIEEKISKAGINDPEKILYVRCPGYINYFAYIKTADTEYIIPFAVSDKLVDLQSGGLYSYDEAKTAFTNMWQNKTTPTPKATATPKPTTTPKPTAKPTETPEPTEKPTASPKPTATPSATAEPQPTAKPDCSSWAESDIENAVSKKILPQDMQSGYTKLIDRADFCRIAYNMLDISGKAENVNSGTHFDDISMKEIYMLSGMGIINGKGENKFAPNDNITREEAAAILSRMVSYLKLNLPEQSGTHYSDDGEISDWAKENVYDVKKLGVMQGVDGNKFDPKSGYTKEQAIVTIMRVMKNIK